jgi:hypothetical protein
MPKIKYILQIQTWIRNIGSKKVSYLLRTDWTQNTVFSEPENVGLCTYSLSCKFYVQDLFNFTTFVTLEVKGWSLDQKLDFRFEDLDPARSR